MKGNLEVSGLQRVLELEECLQKLCCPLVYLVGLVELSILDDFDSVVL